MRTKTLLLTAALCAAGAASSMAQVYSINVVGYATVVAPTNKFAMLANPFDKAGGNTLTNVLTSPGGGSTLQLWNGTGWALYSFAAGNWKQGATIVNNLLIPPGNGFFLKPLASAPATAYTNTFVGSVIVNPGSSGTNALTSLVTPVGELIPYNGFANDTNVNIKVGGSSTLQKWQPGLNAGNGGFQLFTFAAGNWKIGATITNPPIGVAEGFFIDPSVATNWVQSLPPSAP